MLATLIEERFSSDEWLFEPKWDGERCLAFRRGRRLTLFSRNQREAFLSHGAAPRMRDATRQANKSAKIDYHHGGPGQQP